MLQQDNVSPFQNQGFPAGVEPSSGIGLETTPIQSDSTPDWSHAEPLIERLVEIAAGHDGEFVISAVGNEDPQTGAKLPQKHLHVPNGDCACTKLLDAIGRIASERRGNNAISALH